MLIALRYQSEIKKKLVNTMSFLDKSDMRKEVFVYFTRREWTLMFWRNNSQF